jgi:uncharacterized protein (DUF2147 family)
MGPAIHTALLMAMLCLMPMRPISAAEADAQSFGIWTNPQRSVQVRAHPCGKAMCGTVIWANAKARSDASKGGTDKLIGAQLFNGFVRESDSVWRGKVFVPDLGKTFSGTITSLDASTLRADGCLLGRMLCKSQTWTRVDKPSS